jgi:hypothetical protein
MNIARFGKTTTGTIDESQTTFVKFTDSESGQSFRINYKNKIEFYIKPGPFIGVSIVNKHPLLDQHEHTNTILYISTSAKEYEVVDSKISDALYKHYQGWRGIKNYCNIGYGVEKILKQGSGLLYEGPPSGAEVVKKILKLYDISCSSPQEGKANGKKYKVLFLSKNYVVASDFKFTTISIK